MYVESVGSTVVISPCQTFVGQKRKTMACRTCRCLFFFFCSTLFIPPYMNGSSTERGRWCDLDNKEVKERGSTAN